MLAVLGSSSYARMFPPHSRGKVAPGNLENKVVPDGALEKVFPRRCVCVGPPVAAGGCSCNAAPGRCNYRLEGVGRDIAGGKWSRCVEVDKLAG